MHEVPIRSNRRHRVRDSPQSLHAENAFITDGSDVEPLPSAMQVQFTRKTRHMPMKLTAIEVEHAGVQPFYDMSRHIRPLA